MGLKSGFETGNLLVNVFIYVVIPFVLYMIVASLIGGVLTTIGLPDRIAAPTALVITLLIAAYLAYLWIAARRRTGVEQATSTTATKRKKVDSIFTLETTSKGPKQINITNPYRGILVLGGAGAGKSKSFIEPIITQAIEQGFSGLVYDFKFPALAQVVQQATQSNPSPIKTYYVNFDDLTQSHRVNPLNPATMPSSSYADEYARAIINNLVPESIKNPSFFSDNAQGYLSAIIWFLREEHPEFCTLPHAMAVANLPTREVVDMLSTNAETAGTVASLKEAVYRDASGQTAAVVGTLQNALRKINTRDVVWVLSGDDFNLNLNDPNDPKFVTLGNNPTLSGTYGPILALLTTVATKLMNQRGKSRSVVVIDEGPTIYVPNFEQLPATGRENGVATVYSAQDISQMEDMFGKQKKDALISNLNNQFFGRVGNPDTAQHISNLWGKQDVRTITRGRSEQASQLGSGSTSESESWTERSRVTVQEVLNLNPGEFLGQLVESDYSSFKVQIKPTAGRFPPMVSFTTVSAEEVKANFIRIQEEAKALLREVNGIKPAAPTVKKPGNNGQARDSQSMSDEF